MTRGTTLSLTPPSSVPEEETSAIAAMNSLLIFTFGASALLLALAAIPPAWSVRFGLSAHLADVRGGMALAGGGVLVGSGLAVLVLAV